MFIMLLKRLEAVLISVCEILHFLLFLYDLVVAYKETLYFLLFIHGFVVIYNKNVDLCNLIIRIFGQAADDNKQREEYAEFALYEMELVYYELRDYVIKKYGKNYHPIFNNVLDFELYRDNKMAVFSDRVIACYRILRDFIWSLADEDSDEARILLKKYAILNEKGRVRELIFASNIDEYEKERKRLGNIQEIECWPAS